jgi:hypothetical protein
MPAHLSHQPRRRSPWAWAALALLAALTLWVVLNAQPRSPSNPPATVRVVQVTATSVVKVVVVTATHTPPAPSPTRRASSTAGPSRTPKPTLTTAPTLTASPTATRVPLPTVPPRPAGLALHTPSPDGLFKVLTLAIAQGAYRWYETGDVALDRVDAVEGYAVDQHVASDVRRYYANGLPLGTAALHSVLELWFSPTDGLKAIIRASAIQYVLDQPGMLVEGQPHQSGPMTLTPRLLEMDGDTGREWLVSAEFSQYWLQDWLLFDETPAGVLVPLAIPWEPYYTGHSGLDFDATHDFTGDGRAEIWQYDRRALLIPVPQWTVAACRFGLS